MSLTFSEVPNLDAMSINDLRAFWLRHQKGRQSRSFFPNGGKGSKRVTADLANYASNKATAMECRLRGDIQSASMYERIADDIYQGLPAEQRW